MGSQQKKLSTLFPPSRTALYCTFSAPFKSKDAYNPASNLYTNVVGYTTKTTVAGFNFVSPTFKNVSGAAISCQDITLSGENAIEYVDTLQILDEGGATTETYFWTVDNGWQDEDGNKCTKALGAGEGVLISTLQDGVEINIPSAL